MDQLLHEQFARMLDRLPADDDPWPELERSGFLNLLLPEDAGGLSSLLEDVLPLALELGRRWNAPPILHVMAARTVDSAATSEDDLAALLAALPNGSALAASLVAGLMTGAMREILALTVDYARARHQFGRPIAAFQAVQGLIAEMAEQVSASEAAVTHACRGKPHDISLLAAAIAKIRAGEASQRVAANAHAVHGAIGISHEYVLHRHVRNLERWRDEAGSDRVWAQTLGSALLETPSDLLTFIRNTSATPAVSP